MESPDSVSNSNSSNNEEEESFLDAFDELPSSDCFVADLQSDQSTVSDSISEKPINPESESVPEKPICPESESVPEKPINPESESVPEKPINPESESVPEKPINPESESIPDKPINPESESVPEKPINESESSSSSSKALRRRRGYESEPKDSNPESSALSRARKYRIQRKLIEKEKENEGLESAQGHESEQEEESTVTNVIDDGLVQVSAESPELGDPSSSFLEFLLGLVIKAIGFQITLMFTLITCPFSLMYKVYAFFMDPFGTMRFCRSYVRGRSLEVSNLITGSVSSVVSDWFIENKSLFDLFVRYGLGLLWSAYVWFLLCGFLLSSFLVGGIVMRYLVEEPLHMKEVLNFDYTRNSPEAFVAVTSCADAGCGVKCKELTEAQKGGGVHSLRQRLRAAVTLSLPESEYNKRLGMFQVRVDFLSADGTILSSSSQPCMLKFKSEPIRLALTFFKAAPLLAGYLSESQTMNLKFKGFAEGSVPTACLKVIIEQRAEFRRGAGIPELYDASVILDSELPLFRRFLWYWKKTVFIWISTMSFLVELLLAVICCRPLIIPRSRTRGA